jgi:O-antigen/teichoic acid export membrane protein
MKSTPSVVHNIIANFAGKAWSGIFSLAFVPIYIKIMGVEVYGLLGIFISLSALLALLDMGLSATLSRELSRLSVAENSAQESRNLVRTFEVVYWGIGIMIGIFVIILAPLLTKYWINSTSISSETIEQALLIMGILLASQWPGAIYSGGLRGLQRQVVLNVIKSVSVTVQHGGAVLILLFISPSILSFFLWQSFVALLTTIVLAIWLWKSLPKSEHQTRFDKSLFVKNWKFASGIIGISLMTILLSQLDKIILSKMLTLEMFGYYMLAFNVATVLTSLVSPIHSALFPRLSQLVAEEKQTDISNLYHKGCQLVSITILPISITLVFFAEEVLSMWIGDPTVVRNTHMLLSLLIIGTMINSLMILPYTLMLSYGWTRLVLIQNGISVVFLVPLMLWLVNLYGAVGATIVWIILNTAYIFIMIPIMHRRLLKSEMWKWYSIDFSFPIIVVFIVGYTSSIVMPLDLSKYLGFSWVAVTYLIGLLLLGLILPFTREKILRFKN